MNSFKDGRTPYLLVEFMKDHDWMFLALCRLAESETATSREVAEGLGVSGHAKYISLVLPVFKDGQQLARAPYKSGRLHGYVYKLTNKGAEWVLKEKEGSVK